MKKSVIKGISFVLSLASIITCIIIAPVTGVYAASSATSVVSDLYEAEDDGVIVNGPRKTSDGTGYSGTGQVASFYTEGQSVTFPTITVPDSRTYKVAIRYCNGGGASQTLSLYVNDTFIRKSSFSPTGTWSTETSWKTLYVNLNLNAGVNKIKFQINAGDGAVNLDYIMINTHDADKTPKFIEAEDNSVIVNGARKTSDGTGYSGTGQVAYFHTQGQSITFPNINVPDSGVYTVAIRYCNGSGNSQSISMYLNGGLNQRPAFTATSGWSTANSWKTLYVSLNLKAGSNNIKFQINSGDGNINLDYIMLYPYNDLYTPDFLYEAEDASVIVNGPRKSSDGAGYSGTGQITTFYKEGQSVTFPSINVPDARNYRVAIRYCNGGGSSQTLSLYVNNAYVQSPVFSPTGTWSTANSWRTVYVNLNLKSGANSIKFQINSGDGAVNLDYLGIGVITNGDDHGNSFDTATNLGTEQIHDQKANLEFINDVDYFKFTAAKSGEHIITTEGALQKAVLFNNNKTVLKTCVNTVNAGIDFYNMKHTLTAGQTYYLAISTTNVTGSYSFNIAPTLIYTENFNNFTSYTNDNWKTESYYSASGTFALDAIGGVNGSKAMRITNTSANGSTFYRVFEGLEKNTAYTWSADVRGENITYVSSSVSTNRSGANVCIKGSYDTDPDQSEGTFNWKRIKVTVLSSDTGTVTLALRFGYPSSHYTGKAWFDNVKLEKFNQVKASYNNMGIYINNDEFYENDVPIITPGRLQTWLKNLDKAYLSLKELTGYTLYNGNRQQIFMTNAGPGLAHAGNPINYNNIATSNYVTNCLRNLAARPTDNDFAMLHEIGHNYDKSQWNFDGEMLTNFKMIYALEKNNIGVWAGIPTGRGTAGDRIYTGSEIQDGYYKANFENTLLNGVDPFNAITYKLIKIKQNIGWEPYKQTFRYFSETTNTLPTTRTGKFQLFIQKLTDYSGINVKNTCFTTQEWQATINYFNNL